MHPSAHSRRKRGVRGVTCDSPVQKPEALRGRRIATELVGYTRRWFAERNIDVHVDVPLREPAAGVADQLGRDAPAAQGLWLLDGRVAGHPPHPALPAGVRARMHQLLREPAAYLVRERIV